MADKSTMDQSWKLYQKGFSWGLFVCGSVFMFATLFSPVMAPEVYGSAIYAIPAEVWAFGVVAAATMSLYGIYKNGRSRWSPLWRIGGYLLHLFIFMALAIMSSDADFASHMAIYAVFFFSTHMVTFIWVNVGDIYRVFRGC
jgi:hypothetical protein